MLQQVFMVALGGGIGAALRYLTSECISKDLALLFGTGLLGGLTTMSAFSVETIRLIEEQQTGIAASYVGLTMVLCPLLAFIGWKLSETILGST